MTCSSYSIKVPGKLMIAGEYAVLEPNQKSVVIAVDRYVTVHIKSSKQNKLSVPQLFIEDITWKVEDKGVKFNVSDPRLSFIQNSLAVVNGYLQEKSVKICPFELQINSQLDDPLSGKKYGLGSSAAIVVAVISAVLRLQTHEDQYPTLEEIFKLSAITHLITQGSGSGADIAAAVYGGWLEYAAFNAMWVLKELEQGERLNSIIDKPWPNLSIRPLKPPPKLQLMVGWTKEPSATAPLIKSVQNFRQHHLKAYSEFLRESSISVASLIQSFERKDCTEAIKSLAQNRKVLLMLQENAGITIETEKLKTLCSIAETYGSGKSSGAGGGDCGIAFIIDNNERQKLSDTWKAANICPLNLNISEIGVSIK